MSRYPPLTADQEAKVTQLVEVLQSTYDPLPPQLVTLQRLLPPPSADQLDSTFHSPMRQYCYCFLMSREWDLPKALEMMKLAVAYRSEHHLDEQQIFPATFSCKGWDQATLRQALDEKAEPRPTDQRLDRLSAGIRPFFTYGFHKWDRFGQPVLYMMIGRVDEPGLLNQLKQMANVKQSGEAVLWEVVLHILSVAECLQTYQHMQYSTGALKVDAADGIIRSTTIVIDLKGLTYKMLWKPALDLFMNTLREIFKYYPQCIHQILLVNSPAMVMFAYKIVRGVLPPGVQRKVHIANEQETPAVLKTFVEPDCLPDVYGGACHCEGGCIDGFDPNNSKENAAKKEGSVSSNNNNNNAKSSGGVAASNADAAFQDASASQFVATEDITLKAGRQYKRAFPLKEGETVVWEFAAANAHNVAFTTYFVPADTAHGMDWDKAQTSKLESFVVSKENPSEGSAEFVASAEGVLLLVWDNKQSWFTAKQLQMKVYKL